MTIEIKVMFEDSEGIEQEIKAEAQSFEGAQEELGKLENYYNKKQAEAENIIKEVETE